MTDRPHSLWFPVPSSVDTCAPFASPPPRVMTIEISFFFFFGFELTGKIILKFFLKNSKVDLMKK